MGKVVSIDPLGEAEAKRHMVEALRRLGSCHEWTEYFVRALDNYAATQVNALMVHGLSLEKTEFLRGLLKGLDLARSLPTQVATAYDNELASPPGGQPAEEPRGEPGMRLSPVPEGSDSA